MCLFRLSWSASLADFEHVQLLAEYAWFREAVKNFFERVQEAQVYRRLNRSLSVKIRGYYVIVVAQ
jgi:hypothetical protein